jgi:hypothetical protein
MEVRESPLLSHQVMVDHRLPDTPSLHPLAELHVLHQQVQPVASSVV